MLKVVFIYIAISDLIVALSLYDYLKSHPSIKVSYLNNLANSVNSPEKINLKFRFDEAKTLRIPTSFEVMPVIC